MDDTEKMVTSDNNEDEDTSSSDEEEKQVETRAMQLERQISETKYQYEVHLELVDLYEKLGDLKSMRAAYERFSGYFPLTSSIWLTWLRAEMKLVHSDSEKKFVISLFDRAVDDYLSVDLWLEYVQFCIGNCELEQTHAVFERGLNAAGLHANQGSLLWDALRELELAHLALHEQLSDEWRQQAQKVAEAFRRQLSVPLLGMESTYVEWQQWLEQLPAEHGIDGTKIDWGYQKARKVLATYKPFEERLLAAEKNKDRLDTYIDYKQAVTDPATILCLHERAVAQMSLNTKVWKMYCSYTQKLGSIACNVSNRAVRNCPWDEELWIIRLRILEQEKCSDKEVMNCFEEGLAGIAPTPGLCLWLAYIEYLRRASDPPEHLNKIFAQAAKQLGEHGDPTYKILRLQARMCAHNGDMPKARDIWSHILRYSEYRKTATAWLEYTSLEKQCGDFEHLRALYKEAVVYCTDWPQYVFEEWSMFESEYGSLKDVIACKNNRPTNYSIKVASDDVQDAGDGYDPNANKRKWKRRKISEPEIIPTNKKVRVSDIESEKAVFLSNIREDINEKKLREFFPNATAICVPADRKGHSRCFAYVQFADKEDVEKALIRDREPIDGRPLYISKCLLDQTQRKATFKYSTNSEENKLFVRGLPISYSKEEVEGIFQPYGAVAVRIVMHRSGRSKGLAYVEFDSKDKAYEAMKATDQLTVAEHTITVAISAPPTKSASANLELPSFGPTRNSRSRLQLPLIPRSVQTKTSDTTTSQGETSKTNDDFRKMLLNKP